MVIGYHATNSAAAARIFRCGFRCGAKGLAGGAIYFATSEADARRKSNNGDDVVLRCELTMGRVCELDHNGCPSMTLQRLKQMGYDSVKIRRNGGDEYAVYEPSRVRILVDLDDKIRQNPPCEFPPMASTCKLCGCDFVRGPWPHANMNNTGDYCSNECATKYNSGDARKKRWRQEQAAKWQQEWLVSQGSIACPNCGGPPGGFHVGASVSVQDLLSGVFKMPNSLKHGDPGFCSEQCLVIAQALKRMGLISQGLLKDSSRTPQGFLRALKGSSVLLAVSVSDSDSDSD